MGNKNDHKSYELNELFKVNLCNLCEKKNNRVKPKSNRAETKSNRAETKSNRAEVKSNRAGTDLPLAMRFCSYAKKINLQGNILAIFRARFARFARFTEFLT